METKHAEQQNRIILFAVLFVIAVLAAISFVHNNQSVAQPLPEVSTTTDTTSTSTAQTITAVFKCTGGKMVTAVFGSNQVALMLSDGRTVTLLQAISASGARYSTSDEKFVFWNKGNTAIITENGTTTFDGCVTS